MSWYIWVSASCIKGMLRKNFKTPNDTSQLIERGDFPPLINFWAFSPLSVNSNVRYVRLRLNVMVGFVNEGKSEKFGIDASFFSFLFYFFIYFFIFLWVVLNSFILLFYPFVFNGWCHSKTMYRVWLLLKKYDAFQSKSKSSA